MASRDASNPWSQPAPVSAANSQKPKNHRKPQPKAKDSVQPPPAKSATKPDQFQLAQTKHIEAARKHVANDYESSSEEEDMASDSMLASIFKGYTGEKDQLNKTQQFLENVFQSGSAICLICIATVKRADYIWSCGDCHNFFHLSCIQRWANDSTGQKRVQQNAEVAYYNNRGEYVPKKEIRIHWDCPKCRKDYEYAEIPRDYTCFCTKELNPPNHAWLVPHSCGELCQKRLQPDCGHRCVLLCHPGPCPPCPQYIQTKCLCQKSTARTIRCSQRTWTCQQKCTAPLACGSHQCGRTCHAPNQCAPCERRSQHRCQCGNATSERPCSDRHWQCDRLCAKPFACGRHRCEQRCHRSDTCGECPRDQLRSCPCGKEHTQAPCSEDVQPCGSTCDKALECGEHICAERCHNGRCGQCLIICDKRCRCGGQTKQLPCSKQFTCDSKCRQMRSCAKHACNRKCCDGQCPPCDKVCGKQLSCGKHKCTALCHQGQCYPCAQRSTMRCRCGQTTAAVPCGRERQTKPPRCQQPCRQPARCHHAQPHRCHAGECPACQLACGERNETTGCEHPCAARCHDAVRVSLVDKNFRPAGPWDVQVEKVVVKRLPHPPCEVRVAVTCVGGHETVAQPCSDSKARSCGRRCDRQLRCGNHRCQLECHAVGCLTSTKQDESCSPCIEGCIHARPDGCVHSCDKACHLGPCAKCRVNIKFDCHCGVTPIYYKCGDYYTAAVSAEERERMRSCGNRCTRNFPCGHRCLATCHTGFCPNPTACTKKVRTTCKCKTCKADITCDQQRNGFQLECDHRCAAKAEQIRLAADEAKQRQQEAEVERNRLELLEFEKKFGKRKPKERKQKVIEVESGINCRLLWISAGLIGLGVAVMLMYFMK